MEQHGYQPQPSFPPPEEGRSQTGVAIISGVVGGLVVAAVMALLLVTGVISGKTETVVRGGIAATTTASAGDQKTVGEIYKQVSPGVVSIRAQVSGSADGLGPQEGTATGTGFVISKDGYIVTNDHVVDGAQGAVKVSFADDKTVSAKIVGQDPSSDVAVLKVDPKAHALTPLTMGDSAQMSVGDPVVAIGSPYGLDQTATTGIISALQRTITAPNNFSIDNVLQTDAAINPGNSGGPLLNDRGEVVGVNSQIATNGGSSGNVGIGFAVPINRVKQIVPELEKHGRVQYAYLGVSTMTLPSTLANRLKLGSDNGAVVACVVKDGPADKAGLNSGGGETIVVDGAQFNLDADVITRIDSTDVRTSSDVQKAVLKRKPGESVRIELRREGKKKTLDAKLGNRPKTTSNNCSQPSGLGR